VIGGYTMGGRHFDALIFGYWEGDRLMHAARTRSGFTHAVREKLHQRFRGLETTECPFGNLPEARAGRWGDGLTAAKMKQCRWLTPVLVGHFEFVECTRRRTVRKNQSRAVHLPTKLAIACEPSCTHVILQATLRLLHPLAVFPKRAAQQFVSQWRGASRTT